MVWDKSKLVNRYVTEDEIHQPLVGHARMGAITHPGAKAEKHIFVDL